MSRFYLSASHELVNQQQTYDSESAPLDLGKFTTLRNQGLVQFPAVVPASNFVRREKPRVLGWSAKLSQFQDPARRGKRVPNWISDQDVRDR